MSHLHAFICLEIFKPIDFFTEKTEMIQKNKPMLFFFYKLTKTLFQACDFTTVESAHLGHIGHKHFVPNKRLSRRCVD